jgi:hypothetical protein
MGTFTSIVEQVWTLLQGNLMFLLETILGFFRSLFFYSKSYLCLFIPSLDLKS